MRHKIASQILWHFSASNAKWGVGGSEWGANGGGLEDPFIGWTHFDFHTIPRVARAASEITNGLPLIGPSLAVTMPTAPIAAIEDFASSSDIANA